MSENKLPTREEFLRGIGEILNDVRDLAEKDSIADENGPWTDAIFKRMHKLANKRGLDFYAKGYNGGEWLYDAVFWRDSDNEQELFACAEIEWDSNDSRHSGGEYGEHWDYKKVLVAHTRIPIFITEANPKKTVKSEIDERLVVASQFPHKPKPAIFVLDPSSRVWSSNERGEI